MKQFDTTFRRGLRIRVVVFWISGFLSWSVFLCFGFISILVISHVRQTEWASSPGNFSARVNLFSFNLIRFCYRNVTAGCVMMCVSAVLKNWTLVLLGTGRRRRSTGGADAGYDGHRQSWAAVRSSSADDYASTASALSVFSPCALAAALAIALSSRDAGHIT